ncbi:unnamed protein product [Bursaphelenchus okinawaensis]|uniref:LIM zinc-binding domain-containing protein n=1 Tax=Bursaphelenchus okinawaensis TaxID=465554 RepID=A0A811JPS3_9BILA|nr:unnamed protein product [Bursaphelenchus okinawaensis]CAG9076959.1 unnamed protein product [Bursaphelenchus okinawaensis]
MEDFEAKKISDNAIAKDPKKVITRDEAQKLRDSVLRANRPVNPWFTTEDINRYRKAPTSPTQSSNRTTTLSLKTPTYTTPSVTRQTDSNATSPVPSSIKTTSSVPPPVKPKSFVSLSTKTTPSLSSNALREKVNYSLPEKKFQSNEYTIPTVVKNDEHYYENSPRRSEPLRQMLNNRVETKKLVDFVPKRTVTTRNMTQTLENLAHLKELELIEAETAKRKMKLEQYERQSSNNNDGRSSASTYYFSDDSLSEVLSKCDDIAVYRSQLSKCAQCYSIIDDIVLQALDKNFHPSCFRCYHCGMILDGIPFASDLNSRVYCVPDYERLFVTQYQRPVTKPIPRSSRPMYDDIMKSQMRLREQTYPDTSLWTFEHR